MGRWDGADVMVDDAVPLFHAQTALSGAAEVALTQVAVHAADAKPQMSIVGFYYAGARGERAPSLAPHMAKLGEAALANAEGKDVCVLLLDAARADAGTAALGIRVFTRSGNAWVCTGDHGKGVQDNGRLALSANALDLAQSYLEEGRHNGVVDFDDHFEDVTLDWRNLSLTA